MTQIEELPGSASADASLDRHARMVQRYLDVPIAVVCLVEANRQVLPGLAGMPEPWATLRAMPLGHSFSRFVVTEQRPLVVSDLRLDPRTQENPSIGEMGVVAYAGWPLRNSDGEVIGALCAVDYEPRDWTTEDLEALTDLADACTAELSYRDAQREAQAQADVATTMSRRSQVLLALSEGLSVTRTLDDIAYAVERVAVEQLDCLHAGIWLQQATKDGERLRYVASPAIHWVSARRNNSLHLDESNPLGETLSTGVSLSFPDKEAQNRRYPHLDLSHQEGEARMFLPLSLNKVFGALALVWAERREITPDERVTIATLAAYVAQALQRALLLRDREQASLTLQSAMLTRLPQPPDLQLTARYRPAAAQDRVGGDWYDAVQTDTGDLMLMIGDVSGHDISAAAVMGELRSMLRAFAWSHDDPPAANVTRLDHAMAGFEMNRFASLVYARVGLPDEDGVRTVTWTNAGHFPPLVVCPDGTVELLEDLGASDLLIGIDPEIPRHDRIAHLRRGSLLLLYTDGLVERRDENIADGIARLRSAASRHAAKAPGSFLDAVVQEMVGHSHEDDVAVLAVRLG